MCFLCNGLDVMYPPYIMAPTCDHVVSLMESGFECVCGIEKYGYDWYHWSLRRGYDWNYNVHMLEMGVSLPQE